MEDDDNLGIGASVGMNKESYGYFIAGLRIAIREAGYKEKEFAEGIMNPVTLSNNLTGKRNMLPGNIDKCAKKLNKDISDIVLLGMQAESAPAPMPQPPFPGVQAGYVNPTDVLSAVSTLVGQYQKNEERMRFWRAIFDELPVTALIIKDGTVTYQNIKSSAWGNITGTSLCDSCACPPDCRERGDCPSHQAMETRNPTTGYQHIGAGYYKVNITPIRLHDHEYFLIVATEAEKHEGEDRRSGADRRTETI